MCFKPLVNLIRKAKGSNHVVPGFDPDNGNETAKFLFLFEAPGHEAKQSGIISFDNPDPTARNFRRQLEKAGITRDEIAIWNTVPWYIAKPRSNAIRPAKRSDVQAAIKYLKPLIEAMPNLRCIVLMGGVARRAHVPLSHLTTARIVSCHHTSARVLNSKRAATMEKENINVLRFIKKTA
jgi:uracil-DNA glycosylase family 4